MYITENTITNFTESKYGLIEKILSPSNLNMAYKRVKSNKGKGRIDKMEVDSLRSFLAENKDELIGLILARKYSPNPVRRVEITKDNGKKRQLGIPKVIDRVFQQAIQQVLSPILARQFSESSYGFRPGRGAHQALQKCRDYITAG